MLFGRQHRMKYEGKLSDWRNRSACLERRLGPARPHEHRHGLTHPLGKRSETSADPLIVILPLSRHAPPRAWFRQREVDDASDLGHR